MRKRHKQSYYGTEVSQLSGTISSYLNDPNYPFINSVDSSCLYNGWSETFLPARRYASVVLAVTLCPSVRLSVTSRHCTKTAKRRITQTTPYDSPGTLVFDAKEISTKFQRGHLQQGRQIEMGYDQIGDFRPIFRYISKTVQDRDTVTTER